MGTPLFAQLAWKHEIHNPKHETNSNQENPNVPTRKISAFRFRDCFFLLLYLFRISCFEFSPLVHKRFDQAFGRARDDMAADEFADLLGGLSAGFDRGADTADVAGDDGRHKRAADADPLHNLHVGGFGHRVGGFDQTHQTFCFNQTECGIHLGFQIWDLGLRDLARSSSAPGHRGFRGDVAATRVMTANCRELAAPRANDVCKPLPK